MWRQNYIPLYTGFNIIYTRDGVEKLHCSSNMQTKVLITLFSILHVM